MANPEPTPRLNLGRIHSNHGEAPRSLRLNRPRDGRMYQLWLATNAADGSPAASSVRDAIADAVVAYLQIVPWQDPPSALNEAIRRANTAVQPNGGLPGAAPVTLVGALMEEATAATWVATSGSLPPATTAASSESPRESGRQKGTHTAVASAPVAGGRKSSFRWKSWWVLALVAVVLVALAAVVTAFAAGAFTGGGGDGSAAVAGTGVTVTPPAVATTTTTVSPATATAAASATTAAPAPAANTGRLNGEVHLVVNGDNCADLSTSRGIPWQMVLDENVPFTHDACTMLNIGQLLCLSHELPCVGVGATPADVTLVWTPPAADAPPARLETLVDGTWTAHTFSEVQPRQYTPPLPESGVQELRLTIGGSLWLLECTKAPTPGCVAK